jgi:hypothetical protein
LLGASAAGTATIPGFVHAQSDDELVTETLRGSSRSPLTTGEIKALRQKFTAKYAPKKKGQIHGAFIGLEETFGNSRILAYNIVSDGSSAPREQFATRDGAADAPGIGTQGASDRLHEKADELLAEAKANSGNVSTSDVTVSSESDWSDWYSYGSTDLYHEFPKMGDYDVRPGNVKFVNDVRKAPNKPRAGARAKVRMEPGRQICNDGFDEYCSPTIQDGYKNKSATVFQDWDKPVNATPTDELITGTDPEGQISDITTTRTVSISLEGSQDGISGSVGYSSSVSMPGAELVDATTLASGEAEHQFNINSPSSNSSTNNAVFEVGSVADWDPDCANDGYPTQRAMMDIDVDLQWGLDAPLVKWGDVISDSKSFKYVTTC